MNCENGKCSVPIASPPSPRRHEEREKEEKEEEEKKMRRKKTLLRHFGAKTQIFSFLKNTFLSFFPQNPCHLTKN